MADRAHPRDAEALSAAHPGWDLLEGGQVRVRADGRARAAELGLDGLERAFALPAVRRSAWKAWARLGEGPAAVFLKRWEYDRREVWLRSALKWNWPVWSGPRELENLLTLAAAGLRVPRPLAAGERDEGPRRRSFVALEALPGTPLEQLAPPAAPAARRARTRAVADLVRRLHAAGFWHKDLYAGNVFWDEAQGPGLIDCERVERRAGGPPWRWRVKDLAALHGSCGPAWTRADRLRFLRAYLERPRLDPPARRLLSAIARKARRLVRHGAKGP